MKLGQIHTLTVCRVGPYNAFLSGGSLGEITLLKERPERRYAVGDQVEAFVYVDMDDTVVASTQLPEIVAGEIGCLEVVALTRDGAFLDWGLRSDLFVPRSEQMGEMAVGKRCVVLAMLDKTNQRMIASAKLFKHLEEINRKDFVQGQEVDLLVCQRTELGYKAVIDGSHLGMLYDNEIYRKLRVGTRVRGFVKAPRADKKIDLELQRVSAAARDSLEEHILEHLRQRGGQSPLTDKSPPAEIQAAFGVSKRAYKHALGALYKRREIELSKSEIRLAGDDAPARE